MPMDPHVTASRSIVHRSEYMQLDADRPSMVDHTCHVHRCWQNLASRCLLPRDAL